MFLFSSTRFLFCYRTLFVGRGARCHRVVSIEIRPSLSFVLRCAFLSIIHLPNYFGIPHTGLSLIARMAEYIVMEYVESYVTQYVVLNNGLLRLYNEVCIFIHVCDLSFRLVTLLTFSIWFTSNYGVFTNSAYTSDKRNINSIILICIKYL